MIQIYDVNNTSYDKNGDIVLTPISATIHPILNGAWEAELTHPIDPEGRWKSITEESVIKMPSFNGEQLFRIKDVQRQDSGVTAIMEPIFYDSMNDCWLTDIRPTSDNGQQALTLMLSPNNKYSGSSNITKVSTAYYEYRNFMEALNGDIDQSFIKRWGGEILYDNYTVIVNERVGGDYGIELRYGKNIPQDGMSIEIDIRDVITRIYPKGYNGVKMSGSGYVDSVNINKYPISKTTTITYENIKLRSDLEGDPGENDIICDNQDELDAALAEACIAEYDAGLDKPKVTISADMVLLQNTEQYKDIKILETVSLGDTVHCRNTYLDIVSDARVIELEYDSIHKKVTSVVLGDYQYKYFDNVTSASESIGAILNPDGTVMAERVQGILNGIYTQLRLQSTAAQKVDGVAFKVEELDESSPLYGCMIWGTQGIQISTTRTADGRDWDWTTAITANGIVANAIVTGLLSDKTGNNYWDLDTGEFRLAATATVGGQPIATADVTIKKVDVEYAAGDSNTEAPTDGWSTDSPQWEPGKYIWQRTVTTMANNNQVVSDPVCIQGEAGIGVENVVEEYYLSTSSTEQTDGEWSTDQPEWVKGRYIWTRSKVTWTDGSITYTDPVLAKAINGANEAVGDLDDSLDQEGVFNRLTNNGQTQGIYLENGILYINASYIASGTLKGNLIDARNLVVKDNSGNTTFAVDANGNVTIRATSFTLQGNTIAEIVDDALSNYNPADDLSQEELFDILTNNGATDGIYLRNGQIYINATFIDTGNLAGWIIDRANRKIYCSANTVFGLTTITFDAGNGEITVVNNSTGISTTIDHYGVESTSIHGDTVWAKALNIGNDGSSVVITDGSATFFIPIYADNIQSSGTIGFSGTVRLSGTTTLSGTVEVNTSPQFNRETYFNNYVTITNPTTNSNSPYVRMGGVGRLFKDTSSSKRYKDHIGYMEEEESEKLYSLPVVLFKYKEGYLPPEDQRYKATVPGFYAEDMAKYIPIAADYGDIDGESLPENWNDRYLIPYMVKCIQEQHKEIEILKRNQEKVLQALARAGIEVEL